ncbi:MAG: response regulator [Gemmatimonadales bacterium]
MGTDKTRLDVLVIDDNPMVRTGLAKVAERAGYSVASAENGQVALDEISEHNFRVITCDVMMPVLDGIQFFERLRESDPDSASRVIFVTAWADEPLVQRFVRQTGRPVLQKPFEMDEFIDAIKTIAESSR